jgi:hypothetical protein
MEINSIIITTGNSARYFDKLASLISNPTVLPWARSLGSNPTLLPNKWMAKELQNVNMPLLKMNDDDDQSNSSSSYTLGQMKELLEKIHGSPHLAQIYGTYEIKEQLHTRVS